MAADEHYVSEKNVTINRDALEVLLIGLTKLHREAPNCVYSLKHASSVEAVDANGTVRRTYGPCLILGASKPDEVPREFVFDVGGYPVAYKLGADFSSSAKAILISLRDGFLVLDLGPPPD